MFNRISWRQYGDARIFIRAISSAPARVSAPCQVSAAAAVPGAALAFSGSARAALSARHQ
jgi:hypothetical protein